MTPAGRLREVLLEFPRLAVAVSGGVDSMTLATAAHRALGSRVTMHHATSPAVPGEATERTRALAAQEGWELDVFDAGEFDDPAYRANPVNRCFFCKINLYGAVAARTQSPIASGTNLDDLGEYRPGLIAAKQHGVRHPFVEARIDKATVRHLASDMGLGTIAELPSSPCLSSRVETGIRIEAPMLAMVHAAENLVVKRLSPRTVRCRVRAQGVVVELDQATLAGLEDNNRQSLQDELGQMANAAGLTQPIAFALYRTGSAFLQVPS